MVITPSSPPSPLEALFASQPLRGTCPHWGTVIVSLRPSGVLGTGAEENAFEIDQLITSVQYILHSWNSTVDTCWLWID